MTLTPETLTRHELNGLPVRVVGAANPDLVGIAGRVVVETMQTLHVDTGARVVQVQKRGTVLEFALPNGDSGAGDGSRNRRTLEGGDERSSQRREGRRKRQPTDEHRGGKRPRRTDEAAGSDRSDARSDDASGSSRGGRKAPGSASKREVETAGVRPGQSSSTCEGSSTVVDDCEDAVYVTVDGDTLLSRPAHRTERTGDSKWR